MCRLRKLIKQCVFFKVLIGLLTFYFFSPLTFAQEQRRGVFLQDELPSQQVQDSFGDTEVLEPADVGAGMGFEDGEARRGRGETSISGQGLIYQVHVLGEVKRPGTYRISPSMRVTDALQRAGNIRSNGSERFLELRKQGKIKGRFLDLFAYKTFGQLSQNPYLQDNDTIFVPLKKMAVEIEGPVRRPGVFELKNERTLSDIIELAGGFTVGMMESDPIRVIRYGGTEEKAILEVQNNGQETINFKVQDGDVIVIPHKFLTKHQFDYNVKKLPNDNIFYPAYDDRVFVIGAVRGPGAFDFNQYYSVRQYLTLAGGTTTMAKNGKIKVVTVDGKTYKAKGGSYNRVLNPGDTIVVPEKSVPITFYLSLLPTIASLGLSAAALFK